MFTKKKHGAPTKNINIAKHLSILELCDMGSIN